MMAAKRFLMCKLFAMFDHARYAAVRSLTESVVPFAKEQFLIMYSLCAAIYRTFMTGRTSFDVARATNHFVFPTRLFSQSTANTD
jgi:hypothetical protein